MEKADVTRLILSPDQKGVSISRRTLEESIATDWLATSVFGNGGMNDLAGD